EFLAVRQLMDEISLVNSPRKVPAGLPKKTCFLKLVSPGAPLERAAHRKPERGLRLKVVQSRGRKNRLDRGNNAGAATGLPAIRIEREERIGEPAGFALQSQVSTVDLGVRRVQGLVDSQRIVRVINPERRLNDRQIYDELNTHRIAQLEIRSGCNLEL